MKCFAKLKNKFLFKVEGPDAEKFLQGQLSCDVIKLSSGEHCLGAFCSAQGRMHGNFRLLRISDIGFIFQIEKSIAETFIGQLKKYIVFSKAQITELETWTVYGLAENGLDKSGLDHLKGINALINTHELTEQNFFLLNVSSNIQQIWSAVEIDEQLTQSITPVEQSHFELADIQQGIAWVTKNTLAEYIPQMFNWDLIDGISFTKGCYTGQEIVARAHYRGQVKRRLYRGMIKNHSELPDINQEICNSENKAIGNIVAAANSAENIELLFVLNKTDYLEAEIHAGDNSIIQLLPLPYAITE